MGFAAEAGTGARTFERSTRYDELFCQKKGTKKDKREEK